MSKGDAEHAAQHPHGVQHRAEPAAPQTVEQRVGKLEIKDYGVEALERKVIALEERIATLEAKASRSSKSKED